MIHSVVIMRLSTDTYRLVYHLNQRWKHIPAYGGIGIRAYIQTTGCSIVDVVMKYVELEYRHDIEL